MPQNSKILPSLIAGLCLLIIVSIVGSFLWAAISPDWTRAHIMNGAAGITPAAGFTATQQLSALALTALPAAALIIGLWQIFRISLLYRAGKHLEHSVARAFTRAGTAFVFMSGLSFIVHGLRSVILTAHHGPGAKQLSISVQSADLASLVAGLLLILIGRTLQTAVAIKDENAGFV